MTLTEACENGYHWCTDCERISEPKADDAHFQICALCGGYNSLIWNPPVYETRTEYRNDAARRGSELHQTEAAQV